MAAQSVGFSKEFMDSLAGDAAYIAKASTAPNPFKSITAEDGKYYARLLKITGKFAKKGGGKQFTFVYGLIASCVDGSTKYQNEQPKSNHFLRESENKTIAEAYQYLLWELETLGVDIKLIKSNADLLEACSELNKEQPAVIVDIVTEGKYKNVRVSQAITEDAVKQFDAPALEVVDDPEDELEQVIEGESKLSSELRAMDRNGLKSFIKQYELEFKVARSMTEDDIRRGIVAEVEAAVAEQGNLQSDEASSASQSLDDEIDDSTPVASQEQSPFTPEEEPDEPEAPPADPLLSLDRAALKTLLKQVDQTFVVYKTTSDDAIRQQIRDKSVGQDLHALFLKAGLAKS